MVFCALYIILHCQETQKTKLTCNMTIYTNHYSELLKELVKYTFLALLIPFSEILSSSRDNHNHNHNRNNQNCTFINASGSKSCFNNSNIIGQNLQQHPQPQYPTQWDFDNNMQYGQNQNPIYMPHNLVAQQPSSQQQVGCVYPIYNTQQYRHHSQYQPYFNMPYAQQSQLVTSTTQKKSSMVDRLK